MFELPPPSLISRVIMENPMKIDILGVFPYFWFNTHVLRWHKANLSHLLRLSDSSDIGRTVASLRSSRGPDTTPAVASGVVSSCHLGGRRRPFPSQDDSQHQDFLKKNLGEGGCPPSYVPQYRVKKFGNHNLRVMYEDCIQFQYFCTNRID